MKRGLLFIALITLSVVSLSAQDRMYELRAKEPIQCKIIEVGEDIIGYTMTEEYGPDVKFTISRNKLEKIVFENGQELIIKISLRDMGDYVGQRKNIIKVSCLQPLFGATTFSYERSLMPGHSFEVGLGVIGMGANYSNQIGLIIKGGYKFMTNPAYYVRGRKYVHLLKGGYIKPELTYSFHRYSYVPARLSIPEINKNTRESVHNITLMAVVGKQWVVSNIVSFDLFVGLGYGVAIGSEEYNSKQFYYSHYGGDRRSYLAGTAGFKVGVLFGK